MPQIVPISALRNETNKILDLCHEGEPIFVTRNGQGELVVMSQALYEQMQVRLELYEKLEEAESLQKRTIRGSSHREAMANLRARLKR